ncbi:hypothetical protein COO60DRAFT_1479936 [Scenedesmus sp. NREL 46B-D3]|nr:hypothetical protein COO60DRAFT_1479936 [Scenedesmus sp. NREL 46B-D3]
MLQPLAKAAAAAPAGPAEDGAGSTSSSLRHDNKADSTPPSAAVALTAACHSQPAQGGQQQGDSHGETASAVAAAPAAVGGSVSVPASAAGSHASKQQRMLRRLAALQATFAFSGLWHLLIFTMPLGCLQAPIMAAEAILVKWAKNRQLLLPRPVAIFLTNFLLIVVANPLFFGPCDWSGMCSAMFDNVQRYFV